MRERDRPDPDVLLHQLQAAQPDADGRGRLKVYLGMAAGVGKTYAMLADAQAARQRGVDVVIGYLEPHGRQETESMAEGLEHLPLREVEYHNAKLKEFDLDAALRRMPEILLLDELAHTNVPGSRHKKRWQDAEELLRAGIEVHGTVNVQHLESLNDVVAQITGVRVGETLPDSVITEASEVELIDLPPDELIMRLKEGKVYTPEKVEQALQHFFQKKNLSALRELALRKTAERVDREVLNYRAVDGASLPWPTTERILVCIAPDGMATRIVRAARRMANALHGELLAITVESAKQAQVGQSGRQLAYEALQLAERLGAQTAVLAGEDMVKATLEYAREKNVTTLVVGKPAKSRWMKLFQRSFVDDVVRASGDIDVHVITGPEAAGTKLAVAPTRQETMGSGLLFAVLVVAVVSAVNGLLQPVVGEAGTVTLYLLGVAIAGIRSSLAGALLASVLSVGTFNFFFTEPRFSFAVYEPRYWVAFGVLLAVGVMISVLTSRLKEQSEIAVERAKRTSALYDLSRKLSSTRSRRELGEFTAQQVRNVCGCDVAVLIRSRKTGELFAAPASRTGFEDQPKEQAVARWVLEHGKPAGKGTDTLPASAGLYLALSGERGPVGVLAVLFEDDQCGVAKMHLLETFANQLAVAVERANLAKDSHEANLEAERERLRGSLLSAVSDDFLAPLSAIASAADQLQAYTTEGPSKVLAEIIAQQSTRLEHKARNLLEMARLHNGALKLRKRRQPLEEVVQNAHSRTEPILSGRKVHFELSPDLPEMEVDGPLMEQVFVNLLENAARHTPTDTQVWVKARTAGSGTVIEFSNDGPSLPPEDLTRIFGEFSRGTESKSGTGLGLAICRAIVEAHGGDIRAENCTPRGVRFVIELPAFAPAPSPAAD